MTRRSIYSRKCLGPNRPKKVFIQRQHIVNVILYFTQQQENHNSKCAFIKITLLYFHSFGIHGEYIHLRGFLYQRRCLEWCPAQFCVVRWLRLRWEWYCRQHESWQPGHSGQTWYQVHCRNIGTTISLVASSTIFVFISSRDIPIQKTFITPTTIYFITDELKIKVSLQCWGVFSGSKTH